MTDRVPKVNQLLKREIGKLILEEVEFPKDTLVTLTRVESSNNLQQARVYISVIPEDRSEEVIDTLKRRIRYIQARINRRLNMRPVPRIIWTHETMTGEAERIDEIVEEIKNK